MSQAQTATAVAKDVPPMFDDWEMDEQLRHIERVLQSVKASNSPLNNIEPKQESARNDAPHAVLPMWHVAQAEQHHKSKPRHSVLSALAGVFTWSLLSLGAVGTISGLGVLGWSAISSRPQIWNLAFPIAWTSQVVLLIGLMLQIIRLCRHDRAAKAKLENVDEQLHELQSTATLWNASHGATSNTFYSHFASGAGPQLLLNDLKSQLDLLATKITQDK
jgi:hypothetical protein